MLPGVGAVMSGANAISAIGHNFCHPLPLICLWPLPPSAPDGRNISAKYSGHSCFATYSDPRSGNISRFHVQLSSILPECSAHIFARPYWMYYIFWPAWHESCSLFVPRKDHPENWAEPFFNWETTNGTQTDHFPTRPNILCVARPTKGQLWNVAVSSSWDGTSAGAATYCLAPSLLLLSCLDANLLLETGGKTSKVGPLRSKYDPLLSIKGHSMSWVITHQCDKI